MIEIIIIIIMIVRSAIRAFVGRSTCIICIGMSALILCYEVYCYEST